MSKSTKEEVVNTLRNLIAEDPEMSSIKLTFALAEIYSEWDPDELFDLVTAET